MVVLDYASSGRETADQQTSSLTWQQVFPRIQPISRASCVFPLSGTAFLRSFRFRLITICIHRRKYYYGIDHSNLIGSWLSSWGYKQKRRKGSTLEVSNNMTSALCFIIEVLKIKKSSINTPRTKEPTPSLELPQI